VSDPSLWRILDASANRAAEGLRVIEDHLRFALDDGLLCGWCKRLRHELATQLGQFDQGAWLASRDAAHDAGRDQKTPEELRRDDKAGVLRANFQRVQQALRSLEEWSKLVAPSQARQFEQLRYATYELESTVARGQNSRQRLAGVRLYILIDAGHSADDFARRVEQLVAAGAPLLQLRCKQSTDRERLARARLLRQLAEGSNTQIIVNDRADVAAAVAADGVHLGQDDLPVAAARRIVGTQALVGVSTHSLEQARRAVLDGADYLGVGPTFPSSTKAFADFPGTALLAAVAAEIRLPKFAIGGIDLARLRDVHSAGIRRVAVSAAIWQAVDVAAACQQFLEALAEPATTDSASNSCGV
jgi:thiamine-phosphate pyrophosphorylase